VLKENRRGDRQLDSTIGGFSRKKNWHRRGALCCRQKEDSLAANSRTGGSSKRTATLVETQDSSRQEINWATSARRAKNQLATAALRERTREQRNLAPSADQAAAAGCFPRQQEKSNPSTVLTGTRNWAGPQYANKKMNAASRTRIGRPPQQQTSPKLKH
jgi:hypothetical protein